MPRLGPNASEDRDQIILETYDAYIRGGSTPAQAVRLTAFERATVRKEVTLALARRNRKLAVR